MLRGARRHTLATDNVGRRSIQMRAGLGGIGPATSGMNSNAAAPQTVTGTQVGLSSGGGNKKNFDRYERDIMEGFIQYNTQSSIRKIQNDIFFFDPVVGTIVEIRSNLPFSNFELSGCQSKERRLKYTSSVNAMQIRSMIPRISRERMVEGYHTSYMNFDDTDKKFKSIIPQNPEYYDVTPIPVYGRDPLIDIRYPDHVIAAIKSTDPDMKAELEQYAEDLVEMVNNKKTRLDPKFTLYVARTPFTWSPYGISYLRRIIPIWLYEKSLARGTIDLAGRRQKALLHLIMGDDEWLPTNDQLKQITQLFIDADNDSVGAMVATRPGIETNEVRPGSDHWRWDECISGDSLIPTENGLLRIDEMGSENKQFLNTKVLGDESITSTTRWYNRGKKKVIKLEYSNGITSTTTLDHGIRTINLDTLELDWTEAQNICDTHWMCVNTKKLVRNNLLPLNLSDAKVDNRSTKINKPEYMTPDLAFLIAAIVAEGNFDNSTVEFSNSNKAYLNEYTRCMQSVFSLNTTVQNITKREGTSLCSPAKVNCYKLRTSSRQLCKWLKELGVIQIRKEKTPSYYKELPWSIRRADEESQKAYLASYIEGDGTVRSDNGQVLIYSKSSKNLLQMQALLSAHGFYSKKNNHKSISLELDDSFKLIESIEKYMVYKNKFKKKSNKESWFGLPVKSIAEFLKSRRVSVIGRNSTGSYYIADDSSKVMDNGIREQYRKTLYGENRWLSYARYKNGYYDDLLNLIKEVSLNYYQNLKTLLEAEYRFVKLKSVKYLNKKRSVYDLSIIKTSNPAFISNGLVVHNSWDAFTTAKLKALGVPDSIFGDFSVQAAEQTVSSFLEDMLSEREEFTQRVFYNKMFLIIATENDFKLDKKEKELTSNYASLLQQYRDDNDYISLNSQHVMLSADESVDPAEYDLPQVRWEKSLKIVSNDTLFNNLGTLAERGMPAPLRMQAALLGLSAEDMFAGLDQDVEDRKTIEDYKKKLPAPPPQEGEGGDDGGGDGNNMFMESSDYRNLIGSNPLARRGPARSFNTIEQRDTKTGKVLSRVGRTYKVDRENKIIMEAASRIRASQDAKERAATSSNRKSYSYPTKRKM